MNPCGNRTRHTARIGCCAECHRLFSGDSAFALHRVRFRCYDPAERGLVGRPSREYPDETIWGWPNSGRIEWPSQGGGS